MRTKITILTLIIFMIFLCITFSSCGHEHTYEWTTTKMATCEKEGEEIGICSCGESIARIIEATGHDYSLWSIANPATCTEAGERTRTCSRCKSTESETIEATGHDYSLWSIANPATCTEAGERTRTCSRCKSLESKTIEATGHSYSVATCTEPSTCKVCGETDGNALGHTCKVGTCERCNSILYPEVQLPSISFYISTCYVYLYSNGTWKTQSEMSILSLAYEYDNYGNLIITYSARKEYDIYGSAATTECKFKYRLLDGDGYIIYTGSVSVSNLRKNEKIKNKTFSIPSNYIKGIDTEICKLEIMDYLI